MTDNDGSKIIMYGTDWCSDCHRARRILDEQSVDYVRIDIDRHPEARALVAHINDGQARVPTIVFPDGSLLVEPSNRELLRKLALLD
ncbi:MAG: NrdH-redoxin [Anaerolineae bacterium]|nr:NrdH-redoxin [Anaerolineae bacterium]